MSWQKSMLKMGFKIICYWADNKSSQEVRQFMDRFTQPLPKKAEIELIHIDDIPSLWIQEQGVNTKKILLWFHGGAFSVGSIRSHAGLVAPIAIASGCRALIVEYRLAPENPFPAGLNDCIKCYRWLLQQGYGAEDIIIGGDSAGANLALSTMLCLQESGEPLPAKAVLVSGLYDFHFNGSSFQTKAKVDPILDPEKLPQLIKEYLPERNFDDPRVSPLMADLNDLPPLYVSVGSDEILFSDSIALTEKAKAAGVDVTLTVGEHLFHTYPMYAQILPEGRQAVKEIAAFINR